MYKNVYSFFLRNILSSLVLLIAFFLKGNVFARNVLNSKQISIVKVASYSAYGNQKGLKEALIEGLDNGVTINEFKEILVQVYAYCGFPRSLNALNTLMSVVEERGNKDIQGKFPSSKISGDSIKYGTINQTKLIGKSVSSKIYEFVPIIDEFLKSHLFGDIFSRDNIDWQTREIATIAMLASLDNVDSQLNSHINIGKYNGLNDKQISEILNISRQNKVKDVLFGFGDENKLYSKYFVGKSYINDISNNGINISNVTFEPKSRNNWHIHYKTGQTLLVVSGNGWYQEWGKPAQKLKKGDVINIPEGVKHWHGAAKDSWFTHISVMVQNSDSRTEWLESVTEKEYNKLK